MNGKGDKRRPEDRAKIDANWDRIFKSGSKMAENSIAVDKGKSDRDFSVLPEGKRFSEAEEREL